MLERIAQEEEKKKKEEKRASIKGVLKKIVATGAAITALTGAVEYGKHSVQHDKKIISDFDAKLNTKINAENALQELVSDPRTGYVDMEHYLSDPEVDKSPKKLDEMRKYFKTREEK